MKILEFTTNIVWWGCVSGGMVLILIMVFDSLAPFHSAVQEKDRREQYRGEVMVVAALTGMGFYLARYFLH
jgi:hypothetical protein